MQTANPQLQREIATAFESGLTMKYGPIWGALYTEVVRYKTGHYLEPEDLVRDLDVESIPVLNAIVANKILPPTLLAIRSLMIGAALLDRREAVTRWAMMGLERSRQFGGDWIQTESQWQAVLQEPEKFMMYTRQIKYFMMQI